MMTNSRERKQNQVSLLPPPAHPRTHTNKKNKPLEYKKKKKGPPPPPQKIAVLITIFFFVFFFFMLLVLYVSPVQLDLLPSSRASIQKVKSKIEHQAFICHLEFLEKFTFISFLG